MGQKLYFIIFKMTVIWKDMNLFKYGEAFTNGLLTFIKQVGFFFFFLQNLLYYLFAGMLICN